MRTDQHEHKHSATMKPRVHRHALTEVDAAIAAMEVRVAALEETMANVILTISQLPGPITPPVEDPIDPVTPPVEDPIVPVTPPLAVLAYGSAAGDSRDNVHIGWTNNIKISYRFVCTQTSAAQTLRVQQRGGTGYSTGDGGTIQVTIQTNNAGVPSGTVLATLVYSPGNPAGNWEVWTLRTFPTPATLTAGTIYHLVFENIAADPVADSSGMNCLFYYGTVATPRQPVFSDDYACLEKTTGSWAVRNSDAPIFDLAYANGGHDGLNYIGSLASSYGSIGGAAQVRQTMTPTWPVTVSSASVKVKRIAGTGDLTISLKRGTTVLGSGTVAASAIPLGIIPATSAESLGGNTWATIALPPTTLAAGTAYSLVLSAPAGTEYIAVPVQEGTTKGMRSKAFTDGHGQKSADGGTTWQYLYPYLDNGLQDLQFYLR